MLKFIKGLIKMLQTKIELWRHNEFTMAAYLRKQGVQVGENCRIFITNCGSEPYLVKIGNHCTVTGGVQLITHDGGCWIFRHEMPDLNYFGKIEIQDNCFIGINAIIMPNVTIGRNSIVGAGAVVTKDVPPNSIAVGVPARVIGTTDQYKVKMVEEWKSLNIKGNYCDWKEQLIRHFWGDSYDQEMQGWNRTGQRQSQRKDFALKPSVA